MSSEFNPFDMLPDEALMSIDLDLVSLLHKRSQAHAQLPPMGPETGAVARAGSGISMGVGVGAGVGMGASMGIGSGTAVLTGVAAGSTGAGAGAGSGTAVLTGMGPPALPRNSQPPVAPIYLGNKENLSQNSVENNCSQDQDEQPFVPLPEGSLRS